MSCHALKSLNKEILSHEKTKHNFVMSEHFHFEEFEERVLKQTGAELCQSIGKLPPNQSLASFG